jgi:protein-tyrosine-phosphatase
MLLVLPLLLLLLVVVVVAVVSSAINRGVKLTSTSRPLQPVDLNRFDYIIGMDPRNVRWVHLCRADIQG